MDKRNISRRRFLRNGITIGAGYLLPFVPPTADPGYVMTVTGKVTAAKLGFTLSHEHVMVDFAGADKVSKNRYNEDEVYQKALPILESVRQKGVNAIAECTPAYLGRDVRLLKRLSEASGVHIITNTGYYAAAKEKHVPAHAYSESAAELAARWIAEWKDGIENTDVKPGFIKTGVDNYPLSPVQQKLVEAAALTHLQTGLTIGIHTGDGKAAMEEMRIISAGGAHPSSWIWIHAQNEKDREYHLRAARAGAWVSFDGFTKDNLPDYIQFLTDMKKAGLLGRVLISQDAGWYHIGEPGGGQYRDYNDVSEHLLPAIKKTGFSEREIRQLFNFNPSAALSVKRRPLTK